MSILPESKADNDSRRGSPASEHDQEKGSVIDDDDLSNSKPAIIGPWDPSQFPDGGLQAWLVVLGSFCSIFCSVGWINCIGIFQDYYQKHQLQDYSPSDVSWIASLELFVMFSGGIVVGRVYDRFGPRRLIITGTFFHVFGLMMMSISKVYYQILLAQGICSAIGTSCLLSPATNAVSTWFFKKRAYAIGIAAAGSSLGGVILPIMIDRLIPQVGYGWAIRIAAFLILGLLIISILTVKSRIPPHPKPFEIKAYYRPLTESPYLLMTVASCLYYFGLFLPINYIQLQAISYGMSPALGVYLIPILNAASIFGRVLGGLIGDKVGRFNTLTFMCYLSGIITLALWLPAKSNAPLIVYAALYGYASGSFVSLLPAAVAQISDITEIGHRVGLEFAIIGIPALVSNPIGGAFITLDNGSFRDMQIWTGVTLLAGSTMFIFARASQVGFKLNAIA